MAINYDKLMNWKFDDVVHTYTERDTMLYALGIGFGDDPLDEGQLRFVYEKELRTVPSMCVVLGYPGFWVQNPETGIDWVRLVHGEQGFKIHQPLPPAGTVIGRTRLTGIVDKGPGKGAILYSERDVIEQKSGDLLCTMTASTFCRADGGFGGSKDVSPTPHQLPDRAPDLSCDLPTLPRQALIYRLSGDYNPLHAEPAVAAAAKFEKPILHGLCTLGVATHAILKTCCDYQPEKLRGLELRFSAPVYPGDTISTEIWRDGKTISFRSRAVERNLVVLNNGKAELA